MIVRLFQHLKEVKDLRRNRVVGSHSMSYRAPLYCGKYGKVTFIMYSKEGKRPHVHFYRNLEDFFPTTGFGGGCLMLQEAKYYDHASHNERLTNEELSHLVEFMESPSWGSSRFTTWEGIVHLWNVYNKKHQIPYDTPMPDYTKLQEG
jgi:hypothetical protein